jgi:hypothetical protein
MAKYFVVVGVVVVVVVADVVSRFRLFAAAGIIKLSMSTPTESSECTVEGIVDVLLLFPLLRDDDDEDGKSIVCSSVFRLRV